MTPAERTQFIADLRRRLALGDKAERLAKPFARALRVNCLDAEGRLKPESRCARWKAALNGPRP